MKTTTQAAPRLICTLLLMLALSANAQVTKENFLATSESQHIEIAHFTFGLYCQDGKYSQSNVGFTVSGNDKFSVYLPPDSGRLAAGSIAVSDRNGQLIELGKYDVNTECANLPKEYWGAAGINVPLNLPKGVSAEAFISWDRTCQYGVWSWGHSRGWISRAMQSVELKSCSSSIQIDGPNSYVLVGPPMKTNSLCRLKSQNLIQQFSELAAD